MRPRGSKAVIDADRLRVLVRSGASIHQIMDVFRVSKVAVYRACHRHEIPLPLTEVYRKAVAVMVPPVRPAPPPVGAPLPARVSALIATGGRYADLSAWANKWGVGMTQARLEWHRLGLPLRAKEGVGK